MSLLIAIDDLSYDSALGLIRALCNMVSGVKVGWPFILRNGLSSLSIIGESCPGKLLVADLKLADIGYVMKLIASRVIDYVDAVIAHGFVGSRGALGELKEFLDQRGKRLVVVVSMSHPGAEEVYDKALQHVLSVAEALRPWGIVAPATRPKVIREARRRLPWAKILSPGVGAQGARPGEALCAGADYEIVGRAITKSRDPLGAAQGIVREQREMLKRCRRG